MQTQLIFSQEDFPANRTVQQENDLAKKMRDTSGRRCSAAFERLSHVGLWAKTFSDLLIGQTGWFSTRCKLTWKLKGTRYNRMYFQLYPSTLPTEGTEFGLLPTPLAQAREQTNFEAYDARMERLVEKGHKPFTMPLDQMALRGMLPTPTCMYATNATATMKSTQVKEGSMHSVTLTRAMAMGMLPTPRTSDERMHWKTENWKGDDLGSHINEICGTRSHLSPQFVLEMMGFPTDWTLLPFLNGETSQSKQEETP